MLHYLLGGWPESPQIPHNLLALFLEPKSCLRRHTADGLAAREGPRATLSDWLLELCRQLILPTVRVGARAGHLSLDPPQGEESYPSSQEGRRSIGGEEDWVQVPPQGQALWRGCPVGTEAPALATCPQILPPAPCFSGESCSDPCSSQAHPRVFWKTTAGGRGRERPFLSAASQWVACSCFPAFQMKKSLLVEIVQILLKDSRSESLLQKALVSLKILLWLDLSLCLLH